MLIWYVKTHLSVSFYKSSFSRRWHIWSSKWIYKYSHALCLAMGFFWSYHKEKLSWGVLFEDLPKFGFLFTQELAYEILLLNYLTNPNVTEVCLDFLCTSEITAFILLWFFVSKRKLGGLLRMERKQTAGDIAIGCPTGLTASFSLICLIYEIN